MSLGAFSGVTPITTLSGGVTEDTTFGRVIPRLGGFRIRDPPRLSPPVTTSSEGSGWSSGWHSGTHSITDVTWSDPSGEVTKVGDPGQLTILTDKDAAFDWQKYVPYALGGGLLLFVLSR